MIFRDEINSAIAHYERFLEQTIDEIVKETKDEEKMHDLLHENADSAVTYTFDAQVILACSRNCDAYQDFGSLTDLFAKDGENMLWERLAYFAVLADLEEELSRRDLAKEEDESA